MTCHLIQEEKWKRKHKGIIRIMLSMKLTVTFEYLWRFHWKLCAMEKKSSVGVQIVYSNEPFSYYNQGRTDGNARPVLHTQNIDKRHYINSVGNQCFSLVTLPLHILSTFTLEHMDDIYYSEISFLIFRIGIKQTNSFHDRWANPLFGGVSAWFICLSEFQVDILFRVRLTQSGVNLIRILVI